MKTIYALVSGEYSDFRVVALFESPGTAEAAAEARNKTKRKYESGYSVDEYTLIETDDPVPQQVPFWRVERDVKPGSRSRSIQMSFVEPWDAEFYDDQDVRSGFPYSPHGIVAATGCDKEALKVKVDAKVAELLAGDTP